MFDVKLELQVTLDRSWRTAAIVYIRLMGDFSGISSAKRWEVLGRFDHRLPHIGPGPHKWHGEKTVSGFTIVLETDDGHHWARLVDFPDMPTLKNRGNGFMDLIPARPHAHGLGVFSTSFNLQWGVRDNVPQAHLYDASDDMSIWARLWRPTGWFYDNSAGDTLAAMCGPGGAHSSGYLKFKRENERCQVDYEMSGAAVGLPGAGWSRSTENTGSWGWQVYCTPEINGTMKPEDFEGSIVAINIGLGGGVYASGSWDLWFIGFIERIHSALVVIPNPFAFKAGFVYHGLSGGAAVSPGASGQGVAYVGAATLHR